MLFKAATPSRSSSDANKLQELEDGWLLASERAPKGTSSSLVNQDHPNSNEDRVLCDEERQIAAVFDGMGGAAGGERSAQIASGIFTERLEALPLGPATDIEKASKWLSQTLLEAGQAVHINKSLHPEARDGGTTGVAVQILKNKVLALTIGDSRAYRYSKIGHLEKLTFERVPINEEEDELFHRLDEVSTREELRDNEALLNSFIHRNIVPEELSIKRGEAVVTDYDVSLGDLVFVCSDGIHDNLTTTEISVIVAHAAEGGPQAVADALTFHAQKRSEQSTHIRAKSDDMSVACLLVK